MQRDNGRSVEDQIGKGMVCSETIDFILRMYYGRRDKIENYLEKDGIF